MDTKPLLYGLAGFFIGGFIVSVAATTFEKPENTDKSANSSTLSGAMTMDDMVADLRNKTGDDYDEAFIANMIVHHEGAVQMAKLSEERANHNEVKELSRDIISLQELEILEMRLWQSDWGYKRSTENADH